MSHYTVLVISRDGEDVETQLAPYYEQPSDDDEACKPFMEWSCEGANGEHYGPYDSEEEMAKELVEAGTTMVEGPWLNNSQSKWDYWTIGGRWAGMFKLKENHSEHSTEAVRNEYVNGKYTDISIPGMSDSALKSDIDFEAMYAEAEAKAIQEYDKAMGIFGELPIHKSYTELSNYYKDKLAKSDIGYYNNLRKATRADHQAQPRVIAFNMAREADPTFNLDADDFLTPRDKYIQEARNNRFRTHSLLIDNEWSEIEEMRWFGTDNSDDESKIEFNESFDDIIKGLSNDTRLTIVDCHI